MEKNILKAIPVQISVNLQLQKYLSMTEDSFAAIPPSPHRDETIARDAILAAHFEHDLAIPQLREALVVGIARYPAIHERHKAIDYSDSIARLEKLARAWH